METVVAFLVALGLVVMTGEPERAVDADEARAAIQAQADARAERVRLVNVWLRSTRQIQPDDGRRETPPTVMVAGATR